MGEWVCISLTITHRLRELPASADVDDGLDDAVTVIVNEAQRSTLVGNRQSKLVVIDQTHLHSIHTQHTNINPFSAELILWRFDATGSATGRPVKCPSQQFPAKREVTPEKLVV